MAMSTADNLDASVEGSDSIELSEVPCEYERDPRIDATVFRCGLALSDSDLMHAAPHLQDMIK